MNEVQQLKCALKFAITFNFNIFFKFNNKSDFFLIPKLFLPISLVLRLNYIPTQNKTICNSGLIIRIFLIICSEFVLCNIVRFSLGLECRARTKDDT